MEHRLTNKTSHNYERLYCVEERSTIRVAFVEFDTPNKPSSTSLGLTTIELERSGRDDDQVVELPD
jgi:hypothetical protein